MVEILTDHDLDRLKFNIEKLIRSGFQIQGGISMCTKLSGDIRYAVIMVSK